MKKSLFIILLISSAIVQAEKPLVVTTASIFSDMAEQLGDTLIRVESIVPVGGDPHTYDPKPSDLMLLNEASLILKNGLGFEKWMNKLIENSGTSAELILITEGVNAIRSDIYENSPDPHAWMDAENGLIYAENIYNSLLKLLPNHKAYLKERYLNYQTQIRNTDSYIKKQIALIPEGQRILITSHDAFKYYGQKYGLRLESILGTSTDAEAQTRDIERIVEIIRSSNIPAVFIETTVNPKMLKQIAADNNIRVGGSLFSDSIGDKDSEAPTYLDMLRFNTNTIVEALVKEKEEQLPTNQTTQEAPLAKIFVIIGAVMLLVLGFFISKRIA
jgi:ABC-type Zn uptake system ZnuABC Zn-binding protein ZnuA